MKKKLLLLLPFILVIGYLGLSSYSSGPAASAALNLTTGSCGGGGCHTAVSSNTVVLSLDSAGVPVTSGHYVAGQTYTVKITGTNISPTTLPKFGFQLDVVNSGGTASIGTLGTAPGSTHITNIGAFRIFEHSLALAATTLGGATGATYVQSITWTAPATGSGTVKLQGIMNFVNGTGGTDGDQYKVATAALFTEEVAPITGTLTLCAGGTTTLTDATSGGTWSSLSTSIATVNAAGTVFGVAPGNAVINYTTTLGIASVTVTVNPAPSAGTISGPTSVCANSSITLTDVGAVGSGGWSTTTPTITTVTTVGVVTGLTAGTGNIRYTSSNGCGSVFVDYPVTVNPLPVAGSITGAAGVCVGNSITLTSTGASGTGTWSTTTPSFATVNAAGVVTGLSTGTASIVYTVINSCGTATVNHSVAVNALPAAGTISGAATVCQGSLTTLTDAGASGFGTWSSAHNTIATVGVVSGAVGGVAAGIDTIRFIVNNGCGSDTAYHVITVLTAPNGGTISGPTAVCSGSSITLVSAGASGVGTWNNSFPAIATIDPSTGVVTGLSVGSTSISYTVVNSCGTASSAVHNVLVDTVLTAGPLSGPSVVCAGSNISLTPVSPGGGWVSANTAAATVNSSGIVHGVASGVSTITYVVANSCRSDTAYMPITVNPLPIAGTLSGGTSPICIGASVTLTPTVGGGAWTSTAPGNATVTSGGVVTGLAVGNSTISYTVSNGCGVAAATRIVTVITSPAAGTINGTFVVCVGAQVTLTPTVGGGTWLSVSTGVATITAGGVVTGVSAGNSLISYTVSNSCGSNSATRTITVNPLPVAGTISGTSTFCEGTSVTLSETASGGSWSSGSPIIATVNGIGMVTGVSGGTAVISYTVTNSCGTAIASYPVNITPLTTAGTITGSSSACVGFSTTLSDGTLGGTWTINPSSIATINSSGVVTGVSNGAATVTYTVIGTCNTATTTFPITVGTAPVAGTISGLTSLCEGSSISLIDGVSGGGWSSSDATVAIVNSTGVVTGTGGGTATISYTVITPCGSAFTTHAVTVNPLPFAGVIGGAVVLCEAATTTLTETATGGVWSATPATVATVNASGVVTAISGGTVVIAYTVSNVCGTTLAAHTMTVLPLPTIGTISGPSNQCQGSVITLISSLTGGTWSSSNGIVSITSGGLVTGVSFGVDTISYTSTNACGTSSATFVDTVYPTSVIGGIVGDDTVCIGTIEHMGTVVPGGTWAMTNGHATISATGDVTGVTPGLDTVVYSFTNVCGTSTAMLQVTVRTAAACAAMGIASTDQSSAIKLYPNPTGGVFTVELPATNDDATITILDVLGKVIETRIVENNTGSKTTFNLSALAHGSYIVRINSGDQVFREKIVIN